MNAVTRAVTLDDKYVLDRGEVYLTGIQALVRLPLDIARRDKRAGLGTAGYISGYRGSPLGGYDRELAKAGRFLASHHIVFQPGVNEELAATAVWGSQKVCLDGRSDRDGVFGIWYGKAPGVDRTLDVFRHGNNSGTAEHGGVLAIAADDHLAKSSTLPAQSETAFMHAEMPVLNPSDLQDVLDFGLHGIHMSRFSGAWVAMIALTDTMDSSGIVRIDDDRLSIRRPLDVADPRRNGDINPKMSLAMRLETEIATRRLRLPAAKAYARANRLDGVRFGGERARFGIVASGKAYRDVMQTLGLLGLDERLAREIGLSVFKVGMSWPLEPEAIGAFSRDAERLMVVEHKRALVEPQLKELMYHWPAGARPSVWGKTTPEGAPFLPDIRECGVGEIAPSLLEFLPKPLHTPGMRQAAERIASRLASAAEHAGGPTRPAYFCSGCPHSASTVTPEGSRSMAGIGCHVMTELNGRTTDGVVAMGGEGVPWLGQFPFSKDRHIFANLGDGTYYHSGTLAIRAAVAANAPITYKLLFNDAVAMTGGQRHDGPLTVPAMLAQIRAEGVTRIALLSERPQLYDGEELPTGIKAMPREEILNVQREFAQHPGVSVIVFDQTCAAEKRRRRKKGEYEDPPKRLFINARVCEGCGDCSVQSNCISVVPVKTEFGEKRAINQSNCNKDYSCAGGFCPSFVTVEGGGLRKARAASLDIQSDVETLPEPAVALGGRPFNVLVTGVGGMGVTTTSAVLAMAAHLDGLAATTLDMTGLAQKNGPVTSHLRISRRDVPIEGPRIPIGQLDVLIAADLVVAAGPEACSLAAPDLTRAVHDTGVAPTAEFAMHQKLSYEEGALLQVLRGATAELDGADAARLAEKLFGDAIFANMILVGFAWQKGLVPIGLKAIERAIDLNGAAVDANTTAFRAGRLLAEDAGRFENVLKEEVAPREMDLEERLAFLGTELAAYQDAAYAARFAATISRVRAAEAAVGAPDLKLTRAAAESLYRLMAYKDEYEVARLYAAPEFRRALDAQFEGHERVSVQLAPPLLSGTDPRTGRPRKMTFGPWVFRLFAVMARLKWLRHTPFDPFGRTAERRKERALVVMFESLLERIAGELTLERLALATEIAVTPQRIRGYGPVKLANVERAERRLEELLRRWETGPRLAPSGFLHAAE
ncbi:indolepyruvate ferredoxin oxidoreductase family protein [Lutibaculum baratangense]|uniref:Indolepyruvate ferredoxin oxidoreductase, alpha and betaprotein n=1 Tax=Lutibaculum baratangense AMV1 TaxID=631454 RepID=V4QTC3_9HYPH|nr:indolepyruvate ferredoxin oxidoreductase family protein [Lutibaculum baratangense]ESR22992.1 Indolepyruvate ferredoxin oxidoreductase, alpha and betaprotein [Lutibaculum baratangense AMV1]